MNRPAELPEYAEPSRIAASMAVQIAEESGAYADSPLAAALFRTLLPHVQSEHSQSSPTIKQEER
jgi:hypothetical protein